MIFFLMGAGRQGTLMDGEMTTRRTTRIEMDKSSELSVSHCSLLGRCTVHASTSIQHSQRQVCSVADGISNDSLALVLVLLAVSAHSVRLRAPPPSPSWSKKKQKSALPLCACIHRVRSRHAHCVACSPGNGDA